MISEQGIIEKISNETAYVRVAKTSACKHCASKDSCNISDRDMIVEVANRLDAKEGDRVELSIPEGTFLKLSLLVYIMPVIFLMTGAFLGNYLSIQMGTDPSVTAAITGALFLMVSFLGLKVFEKKTKSEDKYHPRMARIVINVKTLQPNDKHKIEL
ncbi:SoxR reducing system RseC family protein [Thermodesulfobacteriota bacterium]